MFSKNCTKIMKTKKNDGQLTCTVHDVTKSIEASLEKKSCTRYSSLFTRRIGGEFIMGT